MQETRPDPISGKLSLGPSYKFLKSFLCVHFRSPVMAEVAFCLWTGLLVPADFGELVFSWCFIQ